MGCLIMVAIMTLSLRAHAKDHEFEELPRLIEMAYEKNQAIQGQAADVDAQDALRVSASGLDSPMIGISTLNRGLRTQYATISQRIRFPNKYFMSSNAQEAVMNRSKAMLQATKLQVRSQVASLYFAIYATQKELQLTHFNIDSVKEFARVAEKKYAAGKTSQSDSMKAHFELTQLELEKIRLIQDEQALQAQLKAALASPNRSDINLVAVELSPPAFFEYKISSGDKKIAEILKVNSPLLRSSQYQLEEASIRSRLAQWEFVPDFQIQYQQRIAGEPTNSSIFSIGITVPLWFWNQYSNASAAVLKEKSQQYRLNDLTLQLSAQAKDLLGKVKTGLKTIEIYKTSLLPQAQGAYNSSRSAYRANKTSFLDLLDSERSLYRVKTGYYKSLSQYVMYLSQLESLVGHDLSNLETSKGVINEK